MIPVPVLTPRLSSYWVSLVSPVPSNIARPLIEGLRNEVVVRDPAPARTFGLLSQVEQLRAAGLIQGGALDNALVCDGDDWVNPPLRFADEPVRHKLLDLLGDLALVGLPRTHVFAYRGSHGLHTAMAAALAAQATHLTVPVPTH